MNRVTEYGWLDSHATASASYITPKIVELLQRIGVQRVLDVGSGNGALCGTLAARGLSVVGCEFDKIGVEIAEAAFPDVHFYNLGVEDDPAPLLNAEGKFSAVISTEVVEHLYSPRNLPLFAGKLMDSGGYLLLSTPYHGYLKNSAISLLGKWDSHHLPLWDGGHIKFWSRRTLSDLLEENGFTVRSFHGVGRMPYLWKSMILVAQKL